MQLLKTTHIYDTNFGLKAFQLHKRYSIVNKYLNIEWFCNFFFLLDLENSPLI